MSFSPEIVKHLKMMLRYLQSANKTLLEPSRTVLPSPWAKINLARWRVLDAHYEVFRAHKCLTESSNVSNS